MVGLAMGAMLSGLLGSEAAAQEMSSGELYGHRSGWMGNAYTMPKGQYSVGLLSRSAIGVTDRIDVKVPVIGAIIGPKFSTEIGLVQRDRFALSVEPLVWFWTWGTFQEASATVRASVAAGPGLLNAGLSHAVVSPLLQDATMTTRAEVNYELFLSDRNRLILAGRTSFTEAGPGSSSGGIYFATAAESIGLSIGAHVGRWDFSGPKSTLDVVGLGGSIPDSQLLPLPHFQLWIRG